VVLRRTLIGLSVTCVAAGLLPAASGSQTRTEAQAAPILREEVHLVPDARRRPHILLMTLGGPNYCVQLQNLARRIDASLLCADYGLDRYETPTQRAGRVEDWGDPNYDAAAARLPGQLARSGVLISKLVVIGVSYSGFANAELVATHPELRAAALIVVDSYLDLTARFNALPAYHETRKEIQTVLGGTPADVPQAYAARSPSNHLDGLATAMRNGMKFVDVWSVSPKENREFRGATCSLTANAQWLSQLAAVLGMPVTGYITHLPHAYALWDYGRGLLGLAGLWTAAPPRTAQPVSFKPGGQPPAGSYCT
jgi:pimeloyl-ACP methyl ester carboxylesterase